MSETKTPTAIQKRAQNREALAAFALETLEDRLPLALALDPDLSRSPKPHYRSAYCYLG